MTRNPHDFTDLYLAPVLLALDDRLNELGLLDENELGFRVALDSDQPGDTRDRRERGLLTSIGHVIDCHGWQLSWDSRGLRVAHDGHGVVLGVPAVFATYLTGQQAASMA
jgi:hypothetical protein